MGEEVWEGVKEIIAIFNTAGVSGKENAQFYIGAIHALLNQKDVDCRVVLSSWRNSDKDRDILMAEFKDRISYNFIDDHAPVSITFNHSCMMAEREFGRPAAFLYADSGTHTQWQQHALATMLRHHKSGPHAMTAAMVDEDTGLPWLYPGQTEDQVFGGKDTTVISVGRTLNLHFQLFDPALSDAFGKILPDVFASFCMESTFTFLCAAVRKRFLACRDIRIQHAMSMDGASSGFREGMGWAHWLAESRRTALEVIRDPEAFNCGFGYEESQKILLHNPRLYNADGQLQDPDRLSRFIKANLYLPVENFDYEKVQNCWIP